MEIRLIILILIFTACNSSKPGPEEILDRSIRFHDPENQWNSLNAVLEFVEEGSAGPRETTVWINNNEGYFRVRRGSSEDHGMVQDSCFINSGDVDCVRAEKLRNYYLYLWGLPMKLKDSGTELMEEVDSLNWNGHDVVSLKVKYQNDLWTYFIDQNDYQLRGYSFVKNDGSGEWIELNGLEEVQSMRIPKERTWYVLNDSSYLGKDKLVSGN